MRHDWKTHHGVIAIARVGERYRPLAIVHQEMPSERDDKLVAGHRLMCTFADQKNYAAVKQELAFAIDFFGQATHNRAKILFDQGRPCPFPFIMTCLLIGSVGNELRSGTTNQVLVGSYGNTRGARHFRREYSVNIVDITDLTAVRYCFLRQPSHFNDTDIHTPLTGQKFLDTGQSVKIRQYPEVYAVLADFEASPFIEKSSIIDCWSTELDIRDLATAAQTDNHSSRLHTKLLLKDLAFAKLVDVMLSSDKTDISVLDESRKMPDFAQVLRRHLAQHQDRVCVTRGSGGLLEVAYAEEMNVDWSMFKNLSPRGLKVALKGVPRRLTSLNLSGTAAIKFPPPRLVAALTTMESIDNLYLMERPNRRSDENGNRLLSNLMLSLPNLIQNRLVTSAMYSNPLRGLLNLPGKSLPLATAAFPVVQILVRNYSPLDHLGSMGVEGRNYECFAMADALMPPLRAVNGLLEYFRYLQRRRPAHSASLSGLMMAYVFVGSAPKVSQGSIDIGPLPSEILANTKASEHNRVYGEPLYSLMQGLNPGEWTILVTRCPTSWSTGAGVSTSDIASGYAFIRSKRHITAEPNTVGQVSGDLDKVELLDMKEFLRRTGSGHHTVDSTWVRCLQPEVAREILREFILEAPTMRQNLAKAINDLQTPERLPHIAEMYGMNADDDSEA